MHVDKKCQYILEEISEILAFLALAPLTGLSGYLR